MRLLIYELSYSTNSEDSLAQAGITMFHSLRKAFSTMPEVQILTVEPGEHQHLNPEDSLRLALEQCDTALIVAPECNDTLLHLTQVAESMQKRILCSPSAAIALSSDKRACLDHWRQLGLPTPHTILWHEGVQREPGFNLAPPFVLKPNCGAGGENTAKINDIKELDFVSVEGESYILQEYIEGEALSVSCLVRDEEVTPISLNRQYMEKNGFTCDSVEIIEDDPREAELFDLAREACSAIPHLRGLVGVDLLYGSQGPVLMELNARITLAFPAMSSDMQRDVVRFLLS